MLYDLESARKKAQRYYASGALFEYFMQEERAFSYKIPLSKPTQKKLLEHLATLSGELKQFQKLNLPLEYKEFAFTSLGAQKLPVGIVFEELDKFLRFVGKIEEFAACKRVYKKALTKFQTLQRLFEEQPKILLENREIIEKILLVCAYFIHNPKPNIYMRELSIVGIDTKFIQKNRAVIDKFLESVLSQEMYDGTIQKLSEHGFEKKYGLKYEESLVRFRILDSALFINGMSDISLPLSQFEKLSLDCEKVFLVENKITTLSLPNIPKAVVIFGKGYSVGMLKNVKWLRDKELYYWGDIDVDGFAILSQARGYFGHLQSLLMDSVLLEKFTELIVKSEPKSYKKLSNLTQEESLLYERLYSDYYGENVRLEQERIPFEYVQKELDAFR